MSVIPVHVSMEQHAVMELTCFLALVNLDSMGNCARTTLMNVAPALVSMVELVMIT